MVSYSSFPPSGAYISSLSSSCCWWAPAAGGPGVKRVTVESLGFDSVIILRLRGAQGWKLDMGVDYWPTSHFLFAYLLHTLFRRRCRHSSRPEMEAAEKDMNMAISPSVNLYRFRLFNHLFQISFTYLASDRTDCYSLLWFTEPLKRVKHYLGPIFNQLFKELWAVSLSWARHWRATS